MLAIAVGGPQLVAEIQARDPGRRGDSVLRVRCFEIAAQSHARLIAAAKDFALVAEASAGRTELGGAEAQLIGAIVHLLLDQSATFRGLEIAASRLADLEGWIQAHLEELISLGRLCIVAGVGDRALQKAFEARRGLSPMRCVAERRLVAARRLLTRVDATHDVNHVAVRLEFSHAGRFAGLYRQTFGESPSQSLRRVRR